MTHPLYDFGGQGPLIHLAVANGFPPASYTPLARLLTPTFRVVSLPPRALWPDRETVEMPDSWETLADDLVAGLTQHDLPPVIAVGHSFGAIASMLAALNAPERIRALCLLDPTIFPPDILRQIKAARAAGQRDIVPLAAGARKRRRAFPSKEAAFEAWRKRRLFADWSDEALWWYVESILVPDGDRVTLVWPPEWEAHYYETIYTDSWEIIPRLRGHWPILVLRGETSDTFFADTARQMQALLPEATFDVLPGHGHLFPHAAPQATADRILAWLQQIA
ncbi:MAG: alpha/beta hydrolase [Anaerolineae bacterium]